MKQNIYLTKAKLIQATNTMSKKGGKARSKFKRVERVG